MREYIIKILRNNPNEQYYAQMKAMTQRFTDTDLDQTCCRTTGKTFRLCLADCEREHAKLKAAIEWVNGK